MCKMDFLKIQKLFCCSLTQGCTFIGIFGTLTSITFLRFPYFENYMLWIVLLRLFSHFVVVIGVWKESHFLLLPYLAFQMILMVLQLIGSVILLYSMNDFAIALLVFIVSNVFLLFEVMFYMTVYSLFCDYQDKDIQAVLQQTRNLQNYEVSATAPPPPAYNFVTL